MSEMPFIEWSCGNRTYLGNGDEVPSECPNCGETHGSYFSPEDSPGNYYIAGEDAEELIEEWRRIASTATEYEVRATSARHADALAELLTDE